MRQALEVAARLSLLGVVACATAEPRAQMWSVADEPLFPIEPDWSASLLSASAYLCTEQRLPDQSYWVCVVSTGDVFYWGGPNMRREGLHRWRIDEALAWQLFWLGQDMSWAPAVGPTVCPVGPPLLHDYNTRLALKVGDETSSLVHGPVPDCTPDPVAALEHRLLRIVEARRDDDWGLPERPTTYYPDNFAAAVEACMRERPGFAGTVHLHASPNGEATFEAISPAPATADAHRCLAQAAKQTRLSPSRLGGTVMFPLSINQPIRWTVGR